ncbi:MAG: YtxH domain-containing protein, partial [Patescibacteria group bacterium]
MKTKKFLAGLAFGALLGGVLGLFFSPANGKKNREKFLKVSRKVSAELVQKLATAKNLSKKEYEKIVENIIKKYSKEDLLEKEAWLQIASELKDRWKEILVEIK